MHLKGWPMIWQSVCISVDCWLGLYFTRILNMSCLSPVHIIISLENCTACAVVEYVVGDK